ncbi:DUF4595 domain-containing protein [Pedobacter sp. N23S346]|uniref:DUF4595 domain-containing protein n=1 Tax=Pedobacter sp. N23S346 TaxID=3402750 RepID=UPI003AD3EDC0
MNNQIKCFMVAFVAIISIASCKKEIDYSDPNGSSCQLTRWKAISGTGEFTLNLEYDAIGRVIKESNSEGGTYTRVFNTNKITATDEDGLVDEFVLSNGRAISSGSGGSIIAGVATFENTKRYSYNADGYLTEVKSYENDILTATTVLTYADGNLIRAVVTDGLTGQITSTTTFSYRSDKAVNVSWPSNPLTNIVDYQTGNYFGKPSKNALASISDTATGPNGDVEIISGSAYAYQFDAKGNATAINITETSTIYIGGIAGLTNTSIDEYTFTYNCK